MRVGSSFVISLHHWFIQRPQLFLPRCRFGWWGSITILVFPVHIIRTFATVTTPVLGVLVNTLQYLDTVDFMQSGAYVLSTQQTQQCCSWCMEYRGTQLESAINAKTELFQMHLEQRATLIATLRSLRVHMRRYDT